MTDSANIMCVNCENYYLPPIYLCPKGHTLCSHCTQDAQYMVSTSGYNLRQAKLKSVTKVKLFCGQCFNFYFNDEGLRNQDLEHSSKTVKYPCTYQKDGCEFEDSYPNIQNHNDTCSFMVVNCFWMNCFWTGTLAEMKHHLKSHSILKIGCQESLVNNSCYTIFNQDESFYLMKIFVTQKCAQFFVLYHGEPAKYHFEILLSSSFAVKNSIRFRKVIPPLVKPKIHGFNSQNCEVFVVDFDFIEQFFHLEKERIYDEVQYTINITSI